MDPVSDPRAPTAQTPACASNETRCGFVAVIGAPNAGKSTIINDLVGTKVSIVSHKVQTTRFTVRGVALSGSTQIVLIDTPGIFKPRRRLDRAMVSNAWNGARNADVIALIVDARASAHDNTFVILERLKTYSMPLVLVLNKIDLVARQALLELTTAFGAHRRFAHVFMVSATQGDGMNDLKKQLAAMMPPGPWLFSEDQACDMPMRLLAAEITREKLLLRLHQELPYVSTVETERWEDRKDGSVRIEQTVYVERDSQKKIALGRGGATIKAISQAARREIAAAIERPVHLFVFVKVRKDWGNDPERYRELGLPFPRSQA